MKALEIFKKVVAPTTASTTVRLPKEKEILEIISLQVSTILALDKEYEKYEVKQHVKSLYSKKNYVDSDNLLKT